MVAESTDSTLQWARAALARGDRDAARKHFTIALELEETPEALEGLAEACWWQDDETATFDARERAYHLYLKKGDKAAAARMAMWMATDSLEFRGEPAVASGWLQRAGRLLEGLPDRPESGWLAVWKGQLALMVHNDPVTAKQFAETRRRGGTPARAHRPRNDGPRRRGPLSRHPRRHRRWNAQAG